MRQQADHVPLDDLEHLVGQDDLVAGDLGQVVEVDLEVGLAAVGGEPGLLDDEHLAAVDVAAAGLGEHPVEGRLGGVGGRGHHVERLARQHRGERAEPGRPQQVEPAVDHLRRLRQ